MYLFGGPIADKTSLRITRCLGKGHREPEYNLPNLALPFTCGIAGCILFGYAAQHNLHFVVLLTGTFLLTTGSLTSLTLVNAFIIECYPQWAGPVLVTVSSLRIFISFFFSSQIMAWIQRRGPFIVFGAFGGMLFAVSLGIPVLFFIGKRMRQWTAGKVAKREPVGQDLAVLERVVSPASQAAPTSSSTEISKTTSTVTTEFLLQKA